MKLTEQSVALVVISLLSINSAFAMPTVIDVRGDFAGDELGRVGIFSNSSLIEPGDLNGDGIPDLIALAPDADSAAGASDDVGLVRAISGADGSVLFDVRGDFAGDRLGSGSLIEPGDLNGDGIPDLVALAPDADSAVGAGQTHLI